MAALTRAQTDLNDAIWSDINPLFGENNLPARLPDAQAVLYCSLYALLNCPVGDRGGIFEPEYGSSLYWFLQEPCDELTAEKIRTSIINCIQRWEPRLQINRSSTTVIPNTYTGTYSVHIAATYLPTSSVESVDLTISK